MRFALFLAGLCLALAAGASARAGTLVNGRFDGRAEIVFLPSQMPRPGQRALVVVLHGALGNAGLIEGRRAEVPLNMDAMAQTQGFIVAYLNGTPVTRRFGPNFLGWNAGGCCGVPAAEGVDDVAYIQGAVHDLIRRYGIDPARVFGMGHSNGAMMTERMLCETTLYAAGIAISGPLDIPVETCPSARGRRVLAIHGAADETVPVAGGTAGWNFPGVVILSEEHARRVFIASGASYELHIVPDVGHTLELLDSGFRRQTGSSIPETAVRFFGLGAP